MMHYDVYTILKKVKTPLRHNLLCSAAADTISASAFCTTGVEIQDRRYVVEFVILEQCMYDIILGCDVLEVSGAIIGC